MDKQYEKVAEAAMAELEGGMCWPVEWFKEDLLEPQEICKMWNTDMGKQNLFKGVFPPRVHVCSHIFTIKPVCKRSCSTL